MELPWQLHQQVALMERGAISFSGRELVLLEPLKEVGQ
jgi:hypothetical protein